MGCSGLQLATSWILELLTLSLLRSPAEDTSAHGEALENPMLFSKAVSLMELEACLPHRGPEMDAVNDL